jgi:hypothetical protein
LASDERSIHLEHAIVSRRPYTALPDWPVIIASQSHPFPTCFPFRRHFDFAVVGVYSKSKQKSSYLRAFPGRLGLYFMSERV